ncbi:MAG: tRNA-dihydrouridine synthase [Pseudomonadota bacterium]
MYSASLYDPLTLPNGAILKNRMIKSAMSDSLGDGYGNPTSAQVEAYGTWARGGVAASIIGEVQANARYPEKPGNLVLDAASDFALFRELTSSGRANGSAIWAQLGHAGALTPPWLGVPRGPSRLDLPGLSCLEMSLEEIKAVPDTLAEAAALAEKVGFSGVQIHAAHGFLLSQFLSPLFNRRQDAYGGGLLGRARFLLEVVEAVRGRVSPCFTVTLKLNATDQLDGGLSEDDSLRVIAALDRTGLDLIDISGGTYFPGAPSSSDRKSSGPYFLDFAREARRVTDLPLMVTGGFKRRASAEAAIRSGDVDAVGLARALVLNPALPSQWEAGGSDTAFPTFAQAPAGGITAWYTLAIETIVSLNETAPDMDPADALRIYEERDRERAARWKERQASAVDALPCPR